MLSLYRRLKNHEGVTGGVPVLLSTEKPRCKLVSMVDMTANNPLDYQVGGRLACAPFEGVCAAHVFFSAHRLLPCCCAQMDRAPPRPHHHDHCAGHHCAGHHVQCVSSARMKLSLLPCRSHPDRAKLPCMHHSPAPPVLLYCCMHPDRAQLPRAHHPRAGHHGQCVS